MNEAYEVEPSDEELVLVPLEAELDNDEADAAAEMTLLLDRVQAARLSGA